MSNVVFSMSYVHTIHDKQVKLHEHHYLTYIQMIVIQMLQNNMEKSCPVLVHKPV